MHLHDHEHHQRAWQNSLHYNFANNFHVTASMEVHSGQSHHKEITDANKKNNNHDSFHWHVKDLNQIRNARVKPMRHELHMISWNIEGFSEDKLVSIRQTMQEKHIDIVCLQEIWRDSCEYWHDDQGF